ncbi:MAG: Gfo/Idh/MocA family oxidoreductase [Cyanobacteria bacterium P01_G01_bin.54]
MIRLAVIGVGRWGQHFARLFAQHSAVELVALVDPHRERLQAVQAQLQLPNRVGLWTDVAQVWAETMVLDAVMIATPATTHRNLIQTALQRGYHVLAEKPLTLEAADCLALTALAQQQGKQLFVDHTYGFHPAMERGKTVIPQLGTCRYGYATRTNLGPIRQDVDALWDLAIHDLAMFNLWLGQTPQRVRAWGGSWLQPGLADMVWATLHYPDGFEATCHWSWDNPDKQRRLGIVGDRGTLVFDEMHGAAPLQVFWGHSQPRPDGGYHSEPIQAEALTFAEQEPLQRVCDRFLENIHTGQTDAAASGDLATQLVQILQALERSLASGSIWQAVESEDR